MVSTVYGCRYMAGMWLACGQHVVGMWLVCGGHVVGMRLACSWHVVGNAVSELISLETNNKQIIRKVELNS